MALACGRDNYNAPGWAMQFRRDLEVLPAYIASPSSLLLVHDAVAVQPWLVEHGLDVEAIEPTQLRQLHDVQVMPWGWSEPLCKQLTLMGLRRSELPSQEAIATVSRLAHRRTSIDIHHAIAREMNRQFSPIPVEIDDAQAVVQWAHNHPGCYVKTPWSGSGRGIYRATEPGTAEFERWCRGAIARQGSVLCEVALPRVLDFALEFRVDGQCEFQGYSVFTSDGQNQYGRGIVDTRDALRDLIAAQYPAIDQLTHAMTRVIDHLITPYYKGYLGVDMLLYRTAQGTIDVDPCVELNLRCTMGLVTAALGTSHHGHFTILPTPQLTSHHHPLTPLHPTTKHAAVIF